MTTTTDKAAKLARLSGNQASTKGQRPVKQAPAAAKGYAPLPELTKARKAQLLAAVATFKRDWPSVDASNNPRYPMQVVAAVLGYTSNAHGKALVHQLQAALGYPVGGAMTFSDYAKPDHRARAKSLGSTLAREYWAQPDKQGTYRLVKLPEAMRKQAQAVLSGGKGQASAANVKATQKAAATRAAKVEAAKPKAARIKVGALTKWQQRLTAEHSALKAQRGPQAADATMQATYGADWVAQRSKPRNASQHAASTPQGDALADMQAAD